MLKRSPAARTGDGPGPMVVAVALVAAAGAYLLWSNTASAQDTDPGTGFSGSGDGVPLLGSSGQTTQQMADSAKPWAERADGDLPGTVYQTVDGRMWVLDANRQYRRFVPTRGHGDPLAESGHGTAIFEPGQGPDEYTRASVSPNLATPESAQCTADPCDPWYGPAGGRMDQCCSKWTVEGRRL